MESDFTLAKAISNQNMTVTMASAKLNWRIEKFKTLLKLSNHGHCFASLPFSSVVRPSIEWKLEFYPHAYSNQMSVPPLVKFKLHQELNEEEKMDFCSLSFLKGSLDSLEETQDNMIKANVKTEIKVQHVQQSWTIENFSHCYKQYLEHVIKLPCFGQEVTWYLKVYPSGDKENSQEYVFICLKQADAKDGENQKVDYKIKNVWVVNIEGKVISMRVHSNPANSDYIVYLKKSYFYRQIIDDTFTIFFEMDVAHEILTTVCDEPLQNLCLSDASESDEKTSGTTASLRLFAVDADGQQILLDQDIINKTIHSSVVSSEKLLQAVKSDGSLTIECDVEYISKVETVEHGEQDSNKTTF